MSERDAVTHGADVVILTALRLELDAVLAVNAGAVEDSAWEIAASANGLPVAFRSFVSASGRPLRIAAAVSADMGATAAVHALLPLVEALRPRCVAMCGVCAAPRGKTQLGDVVAAERLFFQDTGKQLPDRVLQDLTTYKMRDDWKIALEGLDPVAQFRDADWFRRRPLTTEWRAHRALIALRDGGSEPWSAVEPGLDAAAWKRIVGALRQRRLLAASGRELTTKGRQVAEDLLFEHQGKLPDLSPTGTFQPFRLHVAPMGSGSRVIEDEKIWAFVSQAMRKTLGIDMEAAVLGELAHRQRDYRLDVLVMKGVMDFADHGRDDHFKEFAARASAECLLWFLRQQLATERSEGADGAGTPKMSSPATTTRSPRIARDRLDYGIERQRHVGFVGRGSVLAELDRLLLHDATDRWVVVTGGPGMGKSAILSTWLARREAAGAGVPHHFIRRGEYGWDDPEKLVGSLVAQVERRFPHQAEADEDARKGPAARLLAMLTRVSVKELVPRGERLVVLIDGLDEYDPPPGARIGDPLSAFLPHALLPGIRFLCASRPRHPYLPMLEARDGEHASIDLDDEGHAADNRQTVCTFWEREAPRLGLDAKFVDDAVACAVGNLQHAVTLQRHLQGLPEKRRRVETLPRGLEALLGKLWQRVVSDPIAVRGMGILCAAREALTLDELVTVAGWDGIAQREAFVHSAREFLVETRREDNQPEYRLHHASIREHIGSRIGAAALREHHAALSRRLATWPAPPHATMRTYALRHALAHRIEAGDWSAVDELTRDLGFLEAKCREMGIDDVEADVARAAAAARLHADEAVARYLSELSRALARESHWLRHEPGALVPQLWNRFRRIGWSADALDQRLRVPAATAPLLRVRRAVSRESPALVRNLSGHSLNVNACVVTPDDRRVVSASSDKTLQVWDLDTGRMLTTLEGHQGAVSSCAVSPNGRLVISASHDRTLKVWDMETGRALTTLEGHVDWVSSCAVTADGRRVVSASNDKTLKVWDLETGRILTTLEGHTDGVWSCAVTRETGQVVSASYGGILKVWDLAAGRVLRTLRGHAGSVRGCAVAPDDRRVVSASFDGTLKIWDLETGRALITLEGHSGSVNDCAVTADGRHVVSVSDDRSLKVWELETGRSVATFEGHTGWVNGCAATSDGQRVISAADDGTLKVWDIDAGGAHATIDSHAGSVWSCAVTQDGGRVISASDDGTLKVWDLDAGAALATLDAHNAGITSCAVTPDDRCVASASDDHTVRVWDLETGCAVATFEGHTGWVMSCAITADGARLISGSWDRTLKIWDLEATCLLATLEGHGGGVRSCAVTRDGRIVSASSDGTLRVWDASTYRLLITLEGHTKGVNACAVTPDGLRAASASDDNHVKLWDLGTGRMLTTLAGHTQGVSSCAVTADGRFLVSASFDSTLRVWDLATYECLAIHRGDTFFTAVAATTKIICAGDAAGTMWFLDWPRSLLSPR